MPSLVDEALQALVKIILKRTITYLPTQEQLARDLSLSRTVVREAISKLECWNMIEVRPKTGTRIRPPEDWCLVNPELVHWYFQGHSKARELGDALELISEVGPHAGALTNMRVSRNLVPMFVMSDEPDIRELANFHAWIFEQSGNLFYMQLAPIAREFFLETAELHDLTPHALGWQRYSQMYKLVASKTRDGIRAYFNSEYMTLSVSLLLKVQDFYSSAEVV